MTGGYRRNPAFLASAILATLGWHNHAAYGEMTMPEPEVALCLTTVSHDFLKATLLDSSEDSKERPFSVPWSLCVYLQFV
jgi:hypothetical protein